MKLVTVRMDEELICKIDELSQVQGIPRSALIKKILNEALDRRQESFVKEAVLALRQGRKLAKQIDWSRIEKELQQSDPYFPTVDEAIAYSRKRL